MQTKNSELTILKEFEEYIIPLTSEEFQQLEKNLKEEGCRDPLVVWTKSRGQKILIDGHHRYKICQKYGIHFRVKSLSFSESDEVKLWMVDNQMGRRNLTPDQLSYYRGLKYLSLKKSRGGYDKVSAKGVTKQLTTEVLSESYNVSESTVKRDAKFAKGLNIINRTNPKLKIDILSGKVKIRKADVQTLADTTDANKITIKNEADLFNKAKIIREEILSEIESKFEAINRSRISIAEAALKDIEPVFTSKDDKARRIKGRIITAINRAIKSKDSNAIMELKTLVDDLKEVLFE